MARTDTTVIAAPRGNTRRALLEAAEGVLRNDGFAALSTRKVAADAGVPLSQIHYHFGSKEGLVLALLDHVDAAVLARQHEMYAREAPLSERWRQACDFLDRDIASGYVRLLQECIAIGWSNPSVAAKVRAVLGRWTTLLAAVAEEAEARFGPFAPFTPADVAELVASAFVGAEAVLLLGVDETRRPVRRALRKVGDVIEALEATHDEAT